MFLDILEFTVDNMTYVSIKLLLEKSAKIKNNKNKKNMKTFTIFGGF